MGKQLSKKVLAFIITTMMFSAIPQISNAQKIKCPPGYRWYKGNCVQCRSCYMWLSFDLSNNETTSLFLESTPINFPLEKKQPVSLKIYDVKGRLVKIFADFMVIQGENQIEWDRKDAQGNAVSAGTYILQFNVGGKIETRKLFVVS